MDDRPRGREEIRTAVITSARRRFAAEGLSASLRDIARDARVNLGLVHRHFGAKEAVVSAVLQDVAADASARLSGVESLDEMLDMIVHSAVAGEEMLDAYVRMQAWMLLSGQNPLDYQSVFPGMSRIGAAAGSEQQGLVLLTLAASFGWALFARQLTPMVGYNSERRAGNALAQALKHAEEMIDRSSGRSAGC